MQVGRKLLIMIWVFLFPVVTAKFPGPYLVEYTVCSLQRFQHCCACLPVRCKQEGKMFLGELNQAEILRTLQTHCIQA